MSAPLEDLPYKAEFKKRKWTVHDCKVNLAALLNDPRKVRRDYDLFTKTWGETFRELPPGASIRRSKWIPNVQRGHFADYLAENADQLLRHDSQSPKNLRKIDDEEQDLNSDAQSSSFVSNKTVIKSALVAQQERDAIMKTRLALDALPKIFLRTDFNMGNHHIFASVLTVAEKSVDASSIHRREMSSSKLLQEKLNHYLDRVEMAIVRQISLQSDAFFKAMASHDELHEYLNATMTSVKELINKVKQVKSNVVSNSLRVVNLRRTYLNANHLVEKLHMMVTVHQTQPTIQLLLQTSEYAGSLDLIRTTQDVLHQELAGLHCFRHLSSQLTEMERVIGHMMKQEMDECLRTEIHRGVDEGHMCADPHRLTAVVLGLLRQGQFDFFPDFRNEIEVAVKTIIRETVSEAVGGPGEEAETLASRMRSLEFSEWILLLDTLFDNLLVLLRRVKALIDLLNGVARDSVTRGDVCRIHHKSKFTKTYLSTRRKIPIKTKLKSVSEKRTGDENMSNGTSNPFLDSTSNSDYDEKLNPFEDASLDQDSSNPFLNDDKSAEKAINDKKVNGYADENNPFLGDLNESSDFNEIGLMDGLASYEDELISTAADTFVSPADVPKSPKVLPYSNHVTSSDDLSEQVDSDNQITSDEVLTSEEFDNIASSLRDLLCWACNFQQDRCVKVLIAKGKDSSLDKLGSGDFLQLAKSVERYQSESEAVVKQQSPEASSGSGQLSLSGALRNALQAQAGRFVTRFHEERRNKLSLILDNENWKQAEVPSELAGLLQKMVGGRTMSNHFNEQNKLSKERNKAQKATSEYLLLDGKKYAVVGTVLILLKMVSEYCKCSDDLPASTPDLVHRLRDLLTLFNSRTCQLVLGAGALQLVGLKTITTKNLALASRCLQLVLYCIPAIKHHFEEKLNQISQSGEDKSSKHLGVLRHFDHVTKDYQDHVNEVETKLTVIVAGVVDKYLSKWEVKAPVPSYAFRNICKQIVKFHDTVSSLLPENQICRILMKLNVDLKERLRALLRKYDVRNDGGPQHGLVTSDLTFYESNIKNLRGMNEADLSLSSVWS
ncbi:vacuolar protein sorting-associated protein 54-like isoform X2 [Clavelina lepadiformis]|uniref:vacuolar protein sorting-associated protein 54-like isoform X2 n=1 Tax=Clavelina lepadiformis TaxID=159417 RepID=UPI004042759A